MDDIDVLRQMNAVLMGGLDDVLTLLEEGRVWEARETGQRAMYRAEELYVAAEQATDELSKYRNQNKDEKR